jgi:hypothetical protein
VHNDGTISLNAPRVGLDSLHVLEETSEECSPKVGGQTVTWTTTLESAPRPVRTRGYPSH